jgi:uncharacterized protein YpmB
MLKSFLHYSKSQQIGIILLFLIILVAQSIYFFKDFNSVYKVDKEQAAWLANQRIIDSVQLQQANYKPIGNVR